MPVYLTKNGEVATLVSAANATSALRHIIKRDVTVRKLASLEVATSMANGVKFEDADEKEQAPA